MAIEQFARQLTGTHGSFDVVATGGVRQNGVAIRWQHIENVRLAFILSHVGAAHGNSNNFRAAGFNSRARFVHVFVFTGAYQEARVKSAPGDAVTV